MEPRLYCVIVQTVQDSADCRRRDETRGGVN